MIQKTHEWDLSFAHDEVLAGLEKLLAAGGYPSTRGMELRMRFVSL